MFAGDRDHECFHPNYIRNQTFRTSALLILPITLLKLRDMHEGHLMNAHLESLNATLFFGMRVDCDNLLHS